MVPLPLFFYECIHLSFAWGHLKQFLVFSMHSILAASGTISLAALVLMTAATDLSGNIPMREPESRKNYSERD